MHEMRVAFDFNAVIKNRYSGFYTFGKGLLKGIERLDNRPEMLLLFEKKFQKTATEIKSGLGEWAVLKPCPIKLRWIENIWQYIPFPSLNMLTGAYDIYHSFHHFMPLDTKKPKILTVHDLRRYMLPDLYPKSKLDRFERAVKRADHFITVSQATKDDLCEIFKVAPKMVDVVHLACDSSRPITSEEKRLRRQKIARKHGINLNKYFVAFSSSDRRKNINRIVNAFSMAAKEISMDINLVIIGSLIKDKPIAEAANIHNIGYVRDVRPWLECSEGLIFASLYEGFGIPILEAFSASAPVITSNCSSMSEVSGDAALLVDPYDINSIAHAIIRLVRDSHLKDKLVQAGKERLKKFSWKKTAQKTVEAYKKLL